MKGFQDNITTTTTIPPCCYICVLVLFEAAIHCIPTGGHFFADPSRAVGNNLAAGSDAYLQRDFTSEDP